MNLIDQFMERYLREVDYYEKAAQSCARQCEAALEQSGIRAITTWRAKRLDRLRDKLMKRNVTKNYKTLESIYSDIPDLAGVRIALYFPGDRRSVDLIIKREFHLFVEPKSFPSEEVKPRYEKRFSGYWATHYRVGLLDDRLSGPDKRYTQARVEIQVASVLMHSWSEVEHDLVYKPQSVTLSEEGHAILDELNGLVLAGEIALERLQRVITPRSDGEDNVLNNHFDLASYLLKRNPAKTTDNVGRVDIAFRFLQLSNLLRIDQLREYLTESTTSSGAVSLAQQLVESILQKKPDLAGAYAQADREMIGVEPYEELVETRTGEGALRQEALGLFLAHWVALESLVGRMSQMVGVDKVRRPLEFRSIMAQLKLDADVLLSMYRQARELRNKVLHPRSLPPERIDVAELFAGVGLVRKIIEGIESQAKEKQLHDIVSASAELIRTLPVSRGSSDVEDSSDTTRIEVMGVAHYSIEYKSVLIPVTLVNASEKPNNIVSVKIRADGKEYSAAEGATNPQIEGLRHLPAYDVRLEPWGSLTGTWYFGHTFLSGGERVDLSSAVKEIALEVELVRGGVVKEIIPIVGT